jgi:hypothetical protein
MTNSIQPNAPTPKAGMRSEIVSKWGKISAAEVKALKTTDDLVALVQSKYSLEKVKAEISKQAST